MIHSDVKNHDVYAPNVVRPKGPRLPPVGQERVSDSGGIVTVINSPE